ncbi:hypothetical protein Agub_g15680 [Astrephomene gubernaculifera]|uniref:1-phosphatidylinositol 4-kinase n=1 Tax=Astrephomene gubernaculifera TaxID=47775 RepID=A0AAD3E3F5_9CHLO|nr:hypothetical protein Agub_g15680 [Astrephomene gubernaculifera]
MSNVAVEHPRAFPTTVGFRVQGGFELPMQHAPPSTPAHVVVPSSSSSFMTPSQQQPKLSSIPPHPAEGVDAHHGLLLQRASVTPHVSFGSGFASSAPSHKLAGVSAELVSALSTGPSEIPASVGWKGLLEFSETSGCSGVLGPKTASEDLDSIFNRDCKIEVCCTAHTSPSVRRLIKSVIRGIRACQEPDKAVDGMGGTYFFSNDAGKKAAILKPCDEEPLAPNNPKGYVGRQLGDPGWKPTVRVGEAAIREVAAYLLDHDGWARVPTSVLVRARHPIFCYQSNSTSTHTANGASTANTAAVSVSRTTSQGNLELAADAGDTCASPASSASPLPMKLGSLQEFVTHECDTSEMGPGRFSARDVHRIGILDVRLFNTDRHAGNMLVRTPRTASASTADLKSRMVSSDAPYELIPIDHGFCLPETLEAPYFEWLHWPQTMLPFSDEELQYIRDLDIERDKNILRQELPMLRPECLRVLEVCTTLLKTCAAEGLTLFDIASVMTRPFLDSDEEPSELERMCAYARQCVEYTQEMKQCGESEVDEICESGSEAAAEELLLEEEELMNEAPEGICALQLRGTTITSIKEEGEDMLFELDVDSGTGVPFKTKRQAAAAGNGVGVHDPVVSSPDYSPCSSLSSLPPTESVASSGMLNGYTAEGASNSPVPALACSSMAISNGVDRPAPMASSVHVTDGFLWRKLKSQQAAKRATAGKGGALTCPKGGRIAPQVYPPPVAAFSPERMSACFSGMTEDQWAQFMDVVRDQIKAALQSGRWRQSAIDIASCMAMSCPRF